MERSREREKCGTGNPGVATLRVPVSTASSRSCTRLVHAESCTWPPWLVDQNAAGCRSGHVEGAHGPPHWRDAPAHTCTMHMITYTHVRPDTRAAYNSQGRSKETAGQKREEMK
ncbi:hypothetical protein HispidOSU_012543 [Sigmodon hispidus]